MKDIIKTTAGNADHQGENDAPRIVMVDYEKYVHLLEDSDLSDDQKQEFLQAVWGIICEFVSLGFGVHPVQQAQSACGKQPEITVNQPLIAPDMLDCTEPILTGKFIDAAGLETVSATEGIEDDTV